MCKYTGTVSHSLHVTQLAPGSLCTRTLLSHRLVGHPIHPHLFGVNGCVLFATLAGFEILLLCVCLVQLA